MNFHPPAGLKFYARAEINHVINDQRIMNDFRMQGFWVGAHT